MEDKSKWIEKIIFGPAALKVNGEPVEVKLSYELLQERASYCLRAIAVHDELLASLEEMLLWVEDNDEGQSGPALRAKAATAKARGEA